MARLLARRAREHARDLGARGLGELPRLVAAAAAAAAAAAGAAANLGGAAVARGGGARGRVRDAAVPVLLRAERLERRRDRRRQRARLLVEPLAQPGVAERLLGTRPLVGCGREQRADEVDGGGRRVVERRAVERGAGLLDPRLGRRLRRAAERVAAGEEDVEQHARRPHVDFLVVRAAEHLGRHVVERAADLLERRRARRPAHREAEVDELEERRAVGRREQQVLRLEVAVDDVLLVARAERLQHVVRHARREPLRVLRLLREPVGQLAARAQLLHEVDEVGVLVLAVEAAEVAVVRRRAELGHQLDLHREQLLPRRLRRALRGVERAHLRHRLDRHELLVGAPRRKVDRAEVAEADRLGRVDLVFRGEGFECGFWFLHESICAAAQSSRSRGFMSGMVRCSPRCRSAHPSPASPSAGLHNLRKELLHKPRQRALVEHRPREHERREAGGAHLLHRVEQLGEPRVGGLGRRRARDQQQPAAGQPVGGRLEALGEEGEALADAARRAAVGVEAGARGGARSCSRACSRWKSGGGTPSSASGTRPATSRKRPSSAESRSAGSATTASRKAPSCVARFCVSSGRGVRRKENMSDGGSGGTAGTAPGGPMPRKPRSSAACNFLKSLKRRRTRKPAPAASDTSSEKEMCFPSSMSSCPVSRTDSRRPPSARGGARAAPTASALPSQMPRVAPSGPAAGGRGSGAPKPHAPMSGVSAHAATPASSSESSEAGSSSGSPRSPDATRSPRSPAAAGRVVGTQRPNPHIASSVALPSGASASSSTSSSISEPSPSPP